MATTALGPVAARADDAPTASERFADLTAGAEKAYDARAFQEAIDAYLQAYAVVPSADVLYNVAFIYEANLARPKLARDFYSRVIRDPLARPELMKMASERVAAIDGAAAAADARPRVLEPGGDASRSAGGVATKMAKPTETASAVPWILVGVGGAAILSGVIVGVMASSKHDDFMTATKLDQARRDADSGKTEAIAADVLWIGGGALALTGLIWALTSGDSSDEAAIRFSPSFSGAGVGFVMGGEW